MNKLIPFLFCFLFNALGNAQTNHHENEMNRKIFHSIDIEPFSIGYDLYDMNPGSFSFGFGIHIGPAYRFFLNNPVFKIRSFNTDNPDYIQYSDERIKPAINSTWEIAQLKLFYRFSLANNTYLNVGGFAAIGYLRGVEESKIHLASGLQSDIFTGFKHLKFGIRFQFCNIHIQYNSENKSDMWAILVTPAVVQFNF